MPEKPKGPVKLRTLTFAFMAISDRVTELRIDDYIAKYKSFDWWTGEEGSEITSRDFIQQLNEVTTPEVLVVINSGGGDATEGGAIANAIRDKRRDGMKINCKVLSLCASAAVDIACACESTSIYRNAYVMIHESRSSLCGMYQAQELRGNADMLESINSGVAENYARKAGQTLEQIQQWMSETKWFSGQEAVDAGFADILLDETAETNIEPAAQQRYLLMNGAAVAAVDFSKAPEALQALKNKNKTDKQKGANEMAEEIKTVEELKAAYPELCSQMESGAAQSAEKNERARMKALDEVSAQLPADILAEAKYGEKPCDAQAAVYQAVKDGKLVNQTLLGQLETDAAGAGAVPGAANGGIGGGAKLTAEQQKKANAKDLAARATQKK